MKTKYVADKSTQNTLQTENDQYANVNYTLNNIP